jgi:hypothetical protein
VDILYIYILHLHHIDALYLYPPFTVGGSTGDHALLIYLYPSPQTIHSGGGDNSGGGENTLHTTQAPAMMMKRNKWTRNDDENLIVLNFIILLSFI